MSNLTRAGALGAVTALAGAAPLALLTAGAAEKIDGSDLALLNQLLATALQGVQLYNGAVTANLLSPPVAAATGQFASDHAAHRDVLSAAITAGGGTPVAAGTTPLVSEGMTEVAFLASALAFERQTAGIYLAAVPAFKNREITKTVASILGVDAAHVALLAEALRENPAFPTGFVS